MWEVFLAFGEQLVRDFKIVVWNGIAKLIFELLFFCAHLLKEFNVEPVGYLNVTFITLFEVYSEP